MDNKTRWQVYVHNDDTVKKLLNSGFKVWRWKNTPRLTIEGSNERMTFMHLKYNNISCRFIKSQFPNPEGNDLAERMQHEG